MLTFYLGAPSRALRSGGHVGASIPTTDAGLQVCDAHGTCLRRCHLPVVTYDGVHDELMEMWEELLREAHVVHDPEPSTIFTSLIPAAVLMDSRNPPGIIPDFWADVAMPAYGTAVPGTAARRQDGVLRRYFFDVKGLQGGGRAYAGTRAQSGAVIARAARVDGEYRRHAQRLDQAHSPAMTTPIADRLRQYGEVRGLTHGAYAEASPDVHHLTSALADSIARRVWRSWGAASVTEARAFVITRLRRIIGVTGARAMARHFLRRLPFVGLSRADMDRRRRDMAARAIARRQGHTGVDGLRAEDFHPAPVARGE